MQEMIKLLFLNWKKKKAALFYFLHVQMSFLLDSYFLYLTS